MDEQVDKRNNKVTEGYIQESQKKQCSKYLGGYIVITQARRWKLSDDMALSQPLIPMVSNPTPVSQRFVHRPKRHCANA